MKKILMFVFMVCIGFLAFGEVIPSNEVTVEKIAKYISEKYTIKGMASPVMLSIEKNGTTMMIANIPEKNMLLFRISYNAYESRSKKETIHLANRFNYNNILATISVGENGDSRVEYFMVFNNGIDTVNMLKSIEWMFLIANSWEKTLIDGYDG